MPPTPHPIIVVGGGASGIIAAHTAALAGAPVLLLEKTHRIGTKILVSGGGKCNITHDGPIEEVLRAFRPNEARFIRPSQYRYTSQDILELLTSRGLEVYTRPNGRVFPVHQTAKDVVAILEAHLRESGAKIAINTPVTGILTQNNAITGVQTATKTIQTSHLILCTGGSSYPKTGTTGDAYPWIPQLGHTLVPIRAALAPIEIVLKDREPKAGVALRDIILKARYQGKEIARWRDDLLFTHRGISGPTVLGISREIAEQDHPNQATLEADIAPDTTFEQLSEQIKSWKQSNPAKQLSSLAKQYVPESIAPDLLALAQIPPDLKAQELPKKLLNKLIETIKAFPLGTVREVLLEKGEVVAGGVALNEVDPHTMKSLKQQGLYLCGEILDIAGPVGGYNLQAAWAMGFVAGESAAQDWHQANPTP